MHLKVLGLNHTTTPIEFREKFSVGKEAIRRGLRNNFGAAAGSQKTFAESASAKTFLAKIFNPRNLGTFKTRRVR